MRSTTRRCHLIAIVAVIAATFMAANARGGLAMQPDQGALIEQLAQGTPLIQPGQIIGGATKQITDNLRPVRGFLPRPELLKPGGSGQAVLVYRNPDTKWSTYRKVMLDRVAIWAAPDSNLNKASPTYRQSVANYFQGILSNTFKGHCAIVSKPLPGTVRMKFALVDAKTPDAVVNTVATYAPYASTAYSIASLAFNKGVGYFAGTATGEVYAVDATNGTLLWEAVDKRGGTTALIADTTDNWRDVRNIFQAWSKQILGRLTQLGVCR